MPTGTVESLARLILSASVSGRGHRPSTARGAVACRHCHLNHDLARSLRDRTQIAILNKPSVPVQRTGGCLQIWDFVGAR